MEVIILAFKDKSRPVVMEHTYKPCIQEAVRRITSFRLAWST
jgi:hypothetical protein